MTGEAFICDAVRTPFGRYGGVLAKVRTDDLAAVVIKALVGRNPRIDWEALDEVLLGCVNQAGEDNRNVARMALLLAGLPASVPGVTVNRLCSSGLNAVGDAARHMVVVVAAHQEQVRRRQHRDGDAGIGEAPAQLFDLAGRLGDDLLDLLHPSDRLTNRLGAMLS